MKALTAIATVVESIDPFCQFVEFDGQRVFRVAMPNGPINKLVCFPCLGDPVKVRATFGPELPMGLHVKDGLAVYGVELPVVSANIVTRDMLLETSTRLRIAVESMQSALGGS